MVHLAWSNSLLDGFRSSALLRRSALARMFRKPPSRESARMPQLRQLTLVATMAFAVSASAQVPTLGLGIDTTNFDKSVRPQDDFFRYVNGGWLKRADIPADASSWGAFNELRDRSRDALHTILEEASKSNAPAGSIERKVGDLYASY